jgi:SanA protein
MIEKADVGIILGASVYSDKRVSPVVNDRIESAVLLYKNKKVGRLLISGDHAERYYNEVDTIKFWLLKNDIPLSDIYIDPSGFSTYESVYRAKKVFNVQNAVIITQSFHLPRALYLARYWKISAQGFVADQRIYKHARYFLFREYLARVKDFFYIYVLNQE